MQLMQLLQIQAAYWSYIFCMW